MTSAKKPTNKRSPKLSRPINLSTPPIGEREIHHHYYPIKSKRFNFGKLSFGLFLVVIGILYLAKNMGWLNIDINIDLWQLWPMLIIFVGLSLLTGRNMASILAGTVLTLTVLTITLILVLGQTDYGVNFKTTADVDQKINSHNNTQTFPLNIDIDKQVKNAKFIIKTSFSNATIGGNSNRLLSGELKTDFSKPLLSAETVNGTQTVNFEIEPKISLLSSQLNQLNLQLNNNLTSSIYVESLASTVNLNLAKLASHLTTINSTASKINLNLTGALSQTIELSAKASEVTLTLSPDTAVKLTLKDKQEISSDQLKKINSFTYQTLNYDRNANQIIMNLDLTASSLVIK